MRKYLASIALVAVIAVATVPSAAAPAGAVGVAVELEKWCTDHKEHSCTKEVKRGLRNLEAYITGKKNAGKSLECKFRKVRDRILGKKRKKC